MTNEAHDIETDPGSPSHHVRDVVRELERRNDPGTDTPSLPACKLKRRIGARGFGQAFLTVW